MVSALNPPAGWQTTGNVAFASGSATLNETAATQTRLNQVFVLGAQDRVLSFTLAAALGAQSGPQDAFEVALLDSYCELSGHHPQSADPVCQKHLALLQGVATEARQMLGTPLKKCGRDET